MGIEPSTRPNEVIVQHAQGAEVHPLGIVPAGKTERMVGVEPTVVGVAACIRSVVNVLGLIFHGKRAKGSCTGKDNCTKE